MFYNSGLDRVPCGSLFLTWKHVVEVIGFDLAVVTIGISGLLEVLRVRNNGILDRES